MALTYNTHTGDNSTTVFSFTFPYLDQAHVKVYVDEVLKTYVTDWTFASATQVQFVTAPAINANIRIARETDASSPEATFYAGSSVRHTDLNDNQSQVLYSVEEIRENIWDKTVDTISSTETWVSNDDKVATTGATEARIDVKIDTALTTDVVAGNAITVTDNSPGSGQITIAVTDGQIDTAELTDGAVTTAKLDADAVTGAKLADNAVDSEHYVDGSIDTVHIGDLQVTTAKIAADAVTNAKIADDSIDSEHYVDGSIDTAHIGDLQITTDKIADANVTTAKIADANVTTAKVAASAITTDKLADDNITTGKIADSAVSTVKIADDAVTIDKIDDAAIVTASEVAGLTANDQTFYTTSAADSRYFRQDSTETISSGNAWSGSDSFIATTAAIDARIIDIVDDVGGFVPIADETSFPAANPDVNNGAGTIVSILEIQTTRTPASGTVTIANGQGSNTVTINNCGATELTAGYGVLVETTATLNTYNFHRLVPRATEVTTVANSITNVNAVANNINEVNNFGDVYQIAASNPTTRADGSALSEGDLYYNTSLDVIRAYNGTVYENITPDQTQLADIQVVANDLATFTDLGLVSDPLTGAQSGGALETCADNMTDINALADIEDGTTATDAISTLAGISSNVTTVAGISSDVTTVAGKATEIGRLGTADAVADMALLAVTDVIADMAILGTTDVVADMNTLATTDIVADLETCADNNANITIVAGSISNVNTVAGSIADVNRYAAEYIISASAPSSPSAGDLWYDSTNTILKYYNGTAFTGITPGLTDIVLDTTPQLGGNLDAQNNNITNVGTIDGANLSIDFGTI